MDRLLLFFLITISYNSISQVPFKTGSKISKEEAQIALDYHNKVRGEVGSKSLIWSTELAKFAQEWADKLSKKCKMDHRPSSGKYKQLYGENIYWGVNGSALEASKLWYSEISKYKHRKLNNSNWYSTGHYTQMVWKKTTEIGIGISICDNGALIIVANYAPFGNIMGEFAY